MSPTHHPPCSEIEERMAYGTDNQPRAPIFVVLVLDVPVLWEIGFPAGVNLIAEARLGRFRIGPCGS